MVMPGPELLPKAMSVWDRSPVSARECVDVCVVCVTTNGHEDVCGLCCHPNPCRCLRVVLILGVMLILVVCAATWGHGDIQVPAVTKCHVQGHSPTVARVNANTHGPCCYQRP